MTELTPLHQAGDRLELVRMPDDPCPITPGTKGTVSSDSVWIGGRDGYWQTPMRWDNGRTLALVSKVDIVRIIKESDTTHPHPASASAIT